MIKIIKTTLLLLVLSAFAHANEIADMYMKGMTAYDGGHYWKSIRIFKKILKKYPRASNLGRVEAQIGIAYEKRGKFKKAFEAYEVIFKKYPDYENLDDIIEREFAMAEKYASGEMKSIFGLDFAESDKTALEIYDRVVKNFPFGKHSEISVLHSLHILIRTEKYKDAETKIGAFKKAYENSPLMDEVCYLEGYQYYVQIKRAEYDQKNTLAAMERLESYLKAYPEGAFKSKAVAMLNELKDITCEQKYKTAEFYLKQNNRPAAEKYLKSIVENYPDTSWAKLATQRLSS